MHALSLTRTHTPHCTHPHTDAGSTLHTDSVRRRARARYVRPWCGHANCSWSPHTRVAIHCVLRSAETHIYNQPRAGTHYARLGRHLYKHLEAHDDSPESQPLLDYKRGGLLPAPPLLLAPPPPTPQGCLLLAIPVITADRRTQRQSHPHVKPPGSSGHCAPSELAGLQ